MMMMMMTRRSAEVAVLLLLCWLSSAEPSEKKPETPRSTRNIEYSIYHNYPSNRRITTNIQSPLFPGPRPYTRKDATNDLAKSDDLQTDNNHVSETVYGPPKQYVERPIYIKEPEPIIEIIIKESNVSLPPPPTLPPPPKKKEQVQVFYVKYKKNPNGHGKDSIIYDQPVPALSPVVDDHDEEPQEAYVPPVTSPQPPPPSTTLRTIIKPDSETYHSESGIKVTFGKEGWEYGKRSPKADGKNEASSPEPTIRARQSTFNPRRPTFPNYRPDRFPYNFRQHDVYRPHYSQFPKVSKYPTPPENPPPQFKLTPQFQLPRIPPQPPAQFHQANHFPPQDFNFNFPRQPVPYKPFEYLRPQQPQFPVQTHFPVQQQPPLQQPHQSFAPQEEGRLQNHRQQYHPIEVPNRFQQEQNRPIELPNRYQQEQNRPIDLPNRYQQEQLPNRYQPEQQQANREIENQNKYTQSQFPQLQQYNLERRPPLPHFGQINQDTQRVIPPGGELIQSLPKYEEHIQIPVKNNEPTQRPEPKQPSTTPQPPPPRQYFVQSIPSIQTQQNPEQNYQSLSSTTTTTTTERPTTQATQQKPTEVNKELVAQLPDEVPEELRQQLLSSGILSNAQISVLDYDKVGDIPLSALPPDQLANFYNAGGAQQIQSGSEPAPSYAEQETEGSDQEPEGSEKVEMKVVHYNPATEEEKIQEAYVRDDAKQTDPVVVDDQSYNRYLPLKVRGSEFPIPDVPELKGKNVTSVVVLAPITTNFKDGQRVTRDTTVDLNFVSEKLRKLLKEPTKDNYLKFLDSENRTTSDKQSIILLVAGEGQDREIFMYDVSTGSVNKLNGELSTAFVDAAELNASEDKVDASASDIVETRVPIPEEAVPVRQNALADEDLAVEASDPIESRVPVIDALQGEPSEQFEKFVDVSGVESLGS